MAEEAKEGADKARRLWGSGRKRYEGIDREEAMDGDAGASELESREIKSWFFAFLVAGDG